MDIKQLLTMITLSQTLNYQKAAEQLQYAPSTLFKHIQMLEQEVGAPLFCKTGRQLALTPQGEAFLVHANRMVEHYYLALDSVCPAEKLEGTDHRRRVRNQHRQQPDSRCLSSFIRRTPKPG